MVIAGVPKKTSCVGVECGTVGIRSGLCDVC